MTKTEQAINKDIAALNLVFRECEKLNGKETRFYIDIINIKGQESVVVWDSKLNRVCHVFGDTVYYSKLMTKYAILPSIFDTIPA